MPVVDSLRLGDLKDRDLLPDGVYHVRIGKTEEKVPDPSPKNPDPYPYLALTMVVTGNSPEEHHGRFLFDNLSYDPKGQFRLKQMGTAIFGADEEIDLLEKIRDGSLVDSEFQVAVGREKERTDPKSGQTYPERNRVVKYLALGE